MKAANRFSVPFSLSGAFIVAMIAMCFALWPQSAFAQSDPALTVVTTTVDLASLTTSFSVPVVFEDAGDDLISSVNFTLDYDNACIRIADVTADVGSPPEGFVLSKVNDPDTGKLQISIWDPTDPQVALPDGSLVSIKFTLLGTCLTTDQDTDFAFVAPAATFGNTSGASVAGTALGGRYGLDLNQAPTDIAFSGTVNENVAGSRELGTLSATDADSDSATTTFVMAGSCTGEFSNEGFSVNPLAPTKLVTDRTFNYESAPSYTLCIQANDGQGAVFAETVTVNITNVNDTPSDITLDNAQVEEASVIGTVIGQFSTVDEDGLAQNTFTYAVVAGTGDTNNALFALTPEGELSTNTALVYNTKDQYTIRVQSTDAASATVAKQFTILVIGKSLLMLPGEPNVAVVVATKYVTVPVSFTPVGNSITSAEFSVSYDTACVDYKGLIDLQSDFTMVTTDSDDVSPVVVDISSSTTALVKGVMAAMVFEGVAGCTPANSWTDLAFTGTPILKIAGSVDRSSTTSDGILVVVENDAYGDCNSDGFLNAGDFSAIAIENFDIESANTDAAHVHKESWLYSPKATFPGSAKGCDANNDKKVLVSDITCAARMFFGYSCNTTVVAAAAAAPMMSAPGAIPANPGMTVDVPVQFTANGNAISSMAFTLNFDPSQFSFDPADNDGDGVADAIHFNAPASVMRMVVYDAAHGRLQVLLTGVSMPLPLLTDGAVATVQLVGAAGATTQPVSLMLSDVSLGSQEGQTVPVEVGSVDAWFGFRIFMPMAQ